MLFLFIVFPLVIRYLREEDSRLRNRKNPLFGGDYKMRTAAGKNDATWALET